MWPREFVLKSSDFELRSLRLTELCFLNPVLLFIPSSSGTDRMCGLVVIEDVENVTDEIYIYMYMPIYIFITISLSFI